MRDEVRRDFERSAQALRGLVFGITMNLYSHVLPGIQEEAINELNAVLQGTPRPSSRRRKKGAR